MAKVLTNHLNGDDPDAEESRCAVRFIAADVAVAKDVIPAAGRTWMNSYNNYGALRFPDWLAKDGCSPRTGPVAVYNDWVGPQAGECVVVF